MVLALLALSSVGCDRTESTKERQLNPLARMPAEMVGCWESKSSDGKREWLEIGPTRVGGQFQGEEPFVTKQIGGALRGRDAVLVSVSVTVEKSGNQPTHEYELWMESPAQLRIGNDWGEGEAEPDPEFDKC